MRVSSKLFSVVLIAAITAAATDTQALTKIDDFESYKGGQVIGKTYNSKPWCRFGAATNDNVVATTQSDKVMTDRLSAQYGVFWPNTFGAVRYQFDGPTNLSKHKLAAVKMRSDTESTHTQVRLAITDGTTTYAARNFKSLKDKVQHLVFEMGPGDMILIDGSGSYEQVITKAASIGFNFKSTEGQYVETIIFDDFQFVTETDLSNSGN